MVTEEKVMEALGDCYDPEIPINIVDLGLVYDVAVERDKVRVTMTLTAQGCPAHTMISRDVEQRLLRVEGVREATVDVVWDPPWTPDMMSRAAKQKLGFGA